MNRTKASFTVHGKKASVIQFGPDWHNTTAEERLKAKKQLQEAAELASADERDGSVSDGTVVSPGPDDTPRRHMSSEQAKQRHVSSQTITPENFHQSLEYQEADSDGGSDLSDVVEEPISKEGETIPPPAPPAETTTNGPAVYDMASAEPASVDTLSADYVKQLTEHMEEVAEAQKTDEVRLDHP